MNNVFGFLMAAMTGLLVFAGQSASAATVCYTYDVCVGTCNYCGYGMVADRPDFPKTVNTLPMQFSYSRGDTNTGNDVCGSSDCGTLNCNGGTTTYTANQLPAPGGACALNPNNRLPGQFDCSWRDGYCATYCSRTAQATHCYDDGNP